MLTEPGNDMSWAVPPPVWTTTWSATITEIAIVISAWRSSWPWFQRSSSCCIASPSRPATTAAMSRTTNQLITLTCVDETAMSGSPVMIRRCTLMATYAATR